MRKYLIFLMFVPNLVFSQEYLPDTGAIEQRAAVSRLHAAEFTSWVEKSADGTIGVAVDSGRSFRTTALAVSPDGQFVLAVPSMKLYDRATMRLVREFRTGVNRIQTVAFSPDGRFIASGGVYWESGKPFAEIIVWDLLDETPLKRVAYPGGKINTLVFSPDGETLFAGHNMNEDYCAACIAWNIETEQTVWESGWGRRFN